MNISKDNIFYQGNKSIKRAGVNLEYTPEQIKEIKKCKDDIPYFLKTYVKIINLDKGKVPFELYPYQEEMIKTIDDNLRSITLAPRQSGKSVGTEGYLLHYILFNSYKTVAIVANKEKVARKILAQIKQMFSGLPIWLQQGVVEWNKTTIEIENGTKAITSATSGSAIRGESISILYLDECVGENTEITIRNKHTQEIEKIRIIDFYMRLIDNHKAIIIIFSDDYEVLTENGWKNFDGIKLTKSNQYIKITFKDDSILECTHRHKIKINNEFICAKDLVINDQIKNIEYLEETDKRFFDLLNVADGNEYITNNITSHNCAFVPAGIWDDFYSSVYPTVSSSKTAKIILSSTPWGMNHFYKLWTDAENNKNEFVPVRVYWQDVPGRDEKWKIKTIQNIGIQRFRQEYECFFLGSAGTLLNSYTLQNLVSLIPKDIRFDEKFKIYEYPKEDRTYVINSDVAEGLGQDSSTCQVIDVTEKPYKQVAVYEDNTVKTNVFPSIIGRIGEYYNEAVVIVENNGIGDGVLNDLNYDIEYENIFYDDNKFGLRMTKGSKMNGNSYLKSMIEDGELLLTDEDTIDQFSKYIKKGDTYKAELTEHDDLVTPFVLFSYFMNNKRLVEDWLDQDLSKDKQMQNRLSKIEEELLPIGFMCDGDDEINMNEDI